MADHSKPVLTDNYTNVLDQVRGRFEDQAKGFDPANTTATNIQTNTIRWTSASNKWQKWNGTGWGDLSNLYAINISGNSGTVTDGVYTVGTQTIAGFKTFSQTLGASSDIQVGTINDGGKLTISGAAGFSGTGVTVQETSANGKRLRLHQDTSGVVYNATWSSGDPNRHIWQVGGTEYMRLDSNGKLILSSANQGIQFADNTTQTSAGVTLSQDQTISGNKSFLNTLVTTAGGASGTQRFAVRVVDSTILRYQFGIDSDNHPTLWTYSTTGSFTGSYKFTGSQLIATGGFTAQTNGYTFPDNTTQTTAFTGNANTVNNLVVNSGTYLPALTFSDPSFFSTVNRNATWTRVGSVVTVVGSMDLSKTLSSSGGIIDLTLPFSTTGAVSGVASAQFMGASGGTISPAAHASMFFTTGTNRARINVTTENDWVFTYTVGYVFSYVIS
jgi:hypothetical protein